LRDCIASITSQDVANLRILVIDNASTDNSLEVAQDLRRSDRRIEIVRHSTNLGPTASFNEAIDWAAAAYFMILDADDMLTPEALRRAMSLMDLEEHVGMTHGRELRLSLEPGVDFPLGEFPEGDAQWQILAGPDYIKHCCKFPMSFVGAPTVIRRTSVQKQVGYYRPSIPFTDDIEMWMRFALYGSIAETTAPQAIHRVHEQQMSSVYNGGRLRSFLEFEAAFDSFFMHERPMLADCDLLEAEAKRNFARDAYWSAVSHLVRGRPKCGIELFRFALQRYPWLAFAPPLSRLMHKDGSLDRIWEVLTQLIMRRETHGDDQYRPAAKP
jgi:glycosyltransferase involved in cell wall biosynthesis